MIKKILLFIVISFILTSCSNYKEYKTSFKAFSSDINVTLYTRDSKDAKNALNDIKNIYFKYDNLIKQYKEGNIDKKLKNIIKMINDLSKNNEYIKSKNDKKLIKLGIKALANNEVYEYLKNKGISKFFINLNGDIISGYPNNKEYFLVGISNYFDDSITKMVKLKNEYVVTKNIQEVSKQNEIKDGNLSITIITKDIKNGDFIALSIISMKSDDAIEYIKNNNIKAILYYYKNGDKKTYINID